MSESQSGYGAPGSDGRGTAGPGRSSPGGRGAREAADGVRTAVRNRVQELEDRAREKTESLRFTAERKATEATSRAGGTAGRLGRALRAAGQELRGEGDERLARMSDEAAAQVERVSSYLESGSPREMMSDLERTARDNPALFVGGSFALGLLAGRFLRAGEPAAEAQPTPAAEPWRSGNGGPAATGSPGGSGSSRPSGAAAVDRSFQTGPTGPRAGIDREPIGIRPEEGPATGDYRGTPLQTDEPTRASTGPGESPARSAIPGHETRGPGIRTGSSGAASLDAGSGGPRQRENDARPDRRRDDEEEGL